MTAPCGSTAVPDIEPFNTWAGAITQHVMAKTRTNNAMWSRSLKDIVLFSVVMDHAGT
jgi:hypothetical protein